MKLQTKAPLTLVLLALMLSACASLPQNLVSSPNVELSDVQVLGLGFKSQTFLLSFDVANPNSFPLPIRNVGYGIRLDGLRFASGETTSDFTVPAGGDAQFAISVELNLLQTAPQLLAVVREGVRGDIPYELEGRLDVDIPLAPTLKYKSNGTIRLNSESSMSFR